MFDVKWIRDNSDFFYESIERRGLKIDIKQILKIYNQYTSVLTELQQVQMERNKVSKLIGIKKGKGEKSEDLHKKVINIKDKISFLQDNSNSLNADLTKLIEVIPNIPEDDVPEGVSEEDNVIIRKHGNIGKFSFNPSSHEILGIDLNMMDFDRASIMSGSRFVILKSHLARLERALSQFMIDYHVDHHGYIEVSPPSLVKDISMYGTGQLPKFADDLFQTNSNHWLIPTAEVPLTNMFADGILNVSELPIRFTAITNCFRSEAGSAGKDTKGMIRLHEFKKVELVSFVDKKKSNEELERMLGCAEEILKKLELPYRVTKLCCGDLGFSASKTYDLEVWIPSQNKYREISSCSNCGEFQARRMKTRIKYDSSTNAEYIHTLNGSGVAVGRALVSIIENYQTKDGSIIIPNVLIPYMGGLDKIKSLNE